MKEVNKSELAKAIGKSNAVITKIVKAGVLDGCFTPQGKINLKEALTAIERYKGRDYINPIDETPRKPFNELNQLEVIELVEREGDIKFQRPNKDSAFISMKELQDGDFHNYLPGPIVMIEDVNKYLRNSFTDDEIQKVIDEVNCKERGQILSELMLDILRDNKTSHHAFRYLYKMMLQSFYSADAIAFHMDEFLVDD